MQRTGKVINGIRAAAIRSFISFNILLLAFSSVKSLSGGISALRRIKAKRKSMHGLPAVRKYVKAGNRYFFNENIPGWPSSAFNGFFRSEIGRVMGNYESAPLSTIIFAITSRCRLQCRHCYEWNNLSHTDLLTSGDLRQIIIKIKNFGARHIQFSGGEPLERFDDLVSLTEFMSENSDVWILTSGFGLTAEKAFALREAGLTGADISLDHWDEQEHNRSRNNSESYRWALEAVLNCNNAGIATTLSLCAFREFVSHENLMKYVELAKLWGAGFIRILEPRMAGRYSGKDIELRKDQIDLLEKFYLEINSSDKYSGYPIITYPGINQRRIGCSGAGNRYMYINSAGEIHACPFCHRIAGNAVSDELENAVSVLRKYGCQEYNMNFTE